VTAGELNLGPARLSEADRIEARREADEETVREAASFPVYELPAFVRDRYPNLDLADPSTWPEPDRCTDGRPYGFQAYGGLVDRTDRAGIVEDRWRRYLAALDSSSSDRWTRHDLGCRNRWRHEDSRLCGTHDKPWREAIANARRRAARNARELAHRDLAKQLGAYGIVADGFPDSVRLQADAVRDLLRLLAERSS
jgi:hypothetical protein